MILFQLYDSFVFQPIFSYHQLGQGLVASAGVMTKKAWFDPASLNDRLPPVLIFIVGPSIVGLTIDNMGTAVGIVDSLPTIL